MKRLQCMKCGIDASAKWDWLWYSKELPLPRRGEGPPRRQRLWLCPDCAGDLGSEHACDAFLKRTLAAKAGG
jgi:hypothetical protein